MKTIDINQAPLQMSKLVEIAVSGEEIIIIKNNQPMVKLVSLQSTIYNLQLLRLREIFSAIPSIQFSSCLV